MLYSGLLALFLYSFIITECQSFHLMQHTRLHIPSASRYVKQSVVTQISSQSNDADDGGWYDEDTSDAEATPSSKLLDAKTVELRQLQEARKTQTGQALSSVGGNANSSNTEPERDLFIPIFALVSLAGLFGSYGYEMLRLYSRGELYLPWSSN